MSAFITLSIILAGLALVLGYLVVGQVYHNARRNLGERANGEIKRIKDEESTLTESFADQVARGEPVAQVVADYKARRRQLLPATAASLPDPALWGDHELAAYREAGIRDALTTAKRNYNLRTALLLTVVLFSAGLANAGAYFFWFSQPAGGAAARDEFEPLPAAPGPATPSDAVGRAPMPSGPDTTPGTTIGAGTPPPARPGPTGAAPGRRGERSRTRSAPLLRFIPPHNLI